MSDRSIYKLINVSKVYGDKKVLDIDYLEITKGEVMGVVGPSGAGKSTLLRLLNFIEPPTTGVIEFQGISFRTDQEIPLDLRREVTTVFQRPMLLNRSVWENISYGLKLRGIRNTRQRILEITETVGLTDLSNQRARTLSGGEAQRVSLARAMVLKPQVLLLDEPTANLDPYNVNLIEEIIRELNRKEETTMIFVTHNVFQARRIADRVTLMLNGSVIEVADVEPFFEAPRDPRTRSFTNGEMVY